MSALSASLASLTFIGRALASVCPGHAAALVIPSLLCSLTTLHTASLAMMVMELEEMVALNFNLFSDSQLEAMPNELATLRENSDLQTYSSRAERGKPQVKNPHYKPGFEDMGRAVVAGIDGLTEECRKARYFYLKGTLQELPNLEIERQDQGHWISRQSRVQSCPRGIACSLRTTVQLGVRPFRLEGMPRAHTQLL